MSFHEMRLSEPIVRAVSDDGYETPTPIQAHAIPEAMKGRDVLGCAQTGTGKTCAFALPILHRLSENAPAEESESRGNRKSRRQGMRGRLPRALVLCPTRELANQIYESFNTYGRNLHLRHAVIFGGVSQGKQVTALRNGLDVLVATPGRLLDLINQGFVDLSQIEVLVLDEADRMLDMGFINDIRRVVSLVPEDRQTLFFSATVSSEIRRLADSMLKDPARIETAPESTTAESITQNVYLVERKNKPALIELLFQRGDMARTLIFTRTKHGADKLTKILRRAKVKAESIHGNKSQNARTKAMDAFRAGKIPVLVATDIASRGIDVDDITHVVNYDMPIDPETYVHRIGRTARAGASGIAVSFCDRDELSTLRAIEQRTDARPELATDVPELTYALPSRRQGGQSSPRYDAPRRGGGWKSKPLPRSGAGNSGGWKNRKPESTNGSNGGGGWKSKPDTNRKNSGGGGGDWKPKVAQEGGSKDGWKSSPAKAGPRDSDGSGWKPKAKPQASGGSTGEWKPKPKPRTSGEKAGEWKPKNAASGNGGNGGNGGGWTPKPRPSGNGTWTPKSNASSGTGNSASRPRKASSTSRPWTGKKASGGKSGHSRPSSGSEQSGRSRSH
jgi:ATP-dependent RNA helicase RhlE